jgi:hypothetical protein
VRRSCDADKLKLVLAVATLVARNSNEAMVAYVVGSDEAYVWRQCSLESDGRFCVGAFGWNLASVTFFTPNLLKI